MANPVVGFDVELRVADSLAQLRRLGPVSEEQAKIISGRLGAAMKDAEKAAKKLADEAEKAAKGAGDLGDAAGKAGQGSAKLAGALSLLSPAAGGAARDLADLADVGEVAAEAATALGVSSTALTASLGLAAAAVAAGYVAWRIWSEEGTRAAEVAARVGAAQAALVPLIDSARLATIDAALATGEMSAAQAEMAKHGIASQQAIAGATATTRERLAELHAESQGLTRAWADQVEAVEAGAFGWLATTAVFDALTTSTSEAALEQAALMGVMGQAAEVVKGETASVRVAVEAKAALAAQSGRAAHSVEDLTAALLAEAAAAQKSADTFAKRLAEIERASVEADAIVGKSGDFRLTEVGRLERAEEQAVADHLARAREGAQSSEEIASGEATIRANYQAQITAAVARETATRAQLEADAIAEVQAAQAAATASAIGRVNEVGGYLTQALSMASSAAEDASAASADMAARLTQQLAEGEEYYTEAQKAELQSRIDASRDAAEKQFRAAKAAKIAEASASTALAVINAISQSPPPSPFGLIGAGIAAAAGAASIATIASTEPSFHTGYSPDEFNARVLKNESVLSPVATQAVGAGRVREINAGVTQGASDGRQPIIFRHQVFRPFIKDFLTQPSALKSALTAGTIVGHRTNRRGQNG